MKTTSSPGDSKVPSYETGMVATLTGLMPAPRTRMEAPSISTRCSNSIQVFNRVRVCAPFTGAQARLNGPVWPRVLGRVEEPAYGLFDRGLVAAMAWPLSAAG